MILTSHAAIHHQHCRPQELSSVQREILTAIQTGYHQGLPITPMHISHRTGYSLSVVEAAVAQLLAKHLIKAIHLETEVLEEVL